MDNEEAKKHLQKLVEQLSKRERQVLTKVLVGFTNTEIAEALCIAKSTEKIHRSNIYLKLGVKSLSELFKLFEVKPAIKVAF